MSRVVFVVLTTVLATLLGCSREEVPDTPNVLVIGSRGMIPLMADITQRFHEKHPGIRVDFEPSLGDRAIADTRAGLADIGLIGRALRPEEIGVRSHVLARDGIVFGVNRVNEIPPLQETHLVGILTRVYTSWKDVGGSDRPIIIVGPGEGRAIRDVLIEQFALRQPQLRPEPAIGNSKLVWESVAAQPAALGYGSLAAAVTFDNKQEIRLLPFHGVAPTLENVRNRTYPLVRPLVLLTRDQPNPNVQLVLDFALSEQCHDLIEKYGFIPGPP